MDAMLGGMSFIWCSLLILLGGSAALAPKSVAVVGAGMGGAFAADHLRALLGSEALIDVFEATNRSGGRAMSFEYGGQVSPSGWLGSSQTV